MLTSIETEITNVVKEQIEETLREQIQVLVADVISTGEIRVDSYSDNKIPIKDWIKKKFNGNCGYGSAENQIKELAKKFGDEMKQRYDLLFASQIVAKLDEHGLLKEDIAKLLIDKKEVMNENLSRVYFNGSELSYKVNGVEVINGEFPDKYNLKGDYLISGEDLAAITVALNSNKGGISRIDINGYRFNILIEDSDNIMKKLKKN